MRLTRSAQDTYLEEVRPAEPISASLSEPYLATEVLLAT